MWIGVRSAPPLLPDEVSKWFIEVEYELLAGVRATGIPLPRSDRHSPGRGQKLLVSELLPNLLEVVDALLIRGHDIQPLVAVDIGDLELRSDAAVMIKLMANPVGPAVFALQFEPEKNSWLIAAGIIAPVSPPAFAGDEVHEAVTIDVGQADAVSLREALVDLVSLPVAVWEGLPRSGHELRPVHVDQPPRWNRELG